MNPVTVGDFNIAPDLRDYDVILVSSSGGKDSQAMLDYIVRMATALGVKDRVVVVHCDLGRVEWAGTRELAQRQAAHYGLRFEVVSRRQGDLLHQAEFERKMWPGPDTRWCTSDQKTKQVHRVMTKLVDELRPQIGQRPARILDCLGLRAQESPKRAARPQFERNKAASTKTTRLVDRWLPIKHWTEDQVWATIRASGVEHHFAYDLGMPRLSCVFCIYATEPGLLLAGYHNRELLKEYVAVEQRIGHSFKKGLPLIQIQSKLDAGYIPAGPVREWSCAA